MKLQWLINTGVPPFNSWGSNWNTRNTSVPRIGDTVQEGSYRFRVVDVVWNYSADTVFIHVERMDHARAAVLK